MDSLDLVAEAGRDLLGRVDATLLTGGAPMGDPIWQLTRRLGATPGEALEFALSLDEEPLHEAAAELRGRGYDFADRANSLDAQIGSGAWQGAGADAFSSLWQALRGYIGDATADQQSLSGRLRAMASYLDSTVQWIQETRGQFAMTVAEALSSAEAVTLRAAATPLAGGSYLVPESSPFTTATDPDPDAPLPPTAGVAAYLAALSTSHASVLAPTPSGGVRGVVARAAATIGTRVLTTAAERVSAAADLHDTWTPRLTDLRYQPPTDTTPTTHAVTRVDL